MDYQRIYEEFIADRKKIADQIEGYTETHHIVPRAHGGGDEPENLVALIPEDHLFAHLLLEKIHGGKMVAALRIMLSITQNRWEERLHSRRRYGHEKRIAADVQRDAWSGDGNPLFNSTKFDWVNYRTGEKETATLYAMHKKYGGSRPTWTMVANGDRPSAFGWLLVKRLPQHKRSEKGQSFTFVNRDGRRFQGTQAELCSYARISDASAWRIVHMKSVTRCGWRLDGVKDRAFNSPKSGGRPGPRGKTITFIKGRRRISGDRRAIAKILETTPESVSTMVYQIRKGKHDHFKGWRLVA